MRIAQEAVTMLQEDGISVELIDIQTLLPFDIKQEIVDSIKKTSRIVVLDEDVPGGASGYIMQEILESQKAYNHLERSYYHYSRPHRSAYE